MKKITTIEDIIKLGLLTNIKLTAKQAGSLLEGISSVVKYMEEIKNLELDEIPETSRVTEELNIFREDEVEIPGEALQNTTEMHDGYFVAPYLFEKKEA